jgi:adenine-specific DNA-methyltransferase
VRIFAAVRYIGNKTKLLGFIRRILSARGIRGGTAVDPFTGTASVARALKARGFAVTASDVMEYAYVFARAYVTVPTVPAVPDLAAAIGLRKPTLVEAVHHLERLPGETGFVSEHYTPAGAEGAAHGRMYFTPGNGARIDAVRRTLDDWRRARLLPDDAYFLLLAALLEAADRVANTTGVYAAFVKSWQPNALRPLELRLPRIVRGNGCTAARGDALEIVRGLEPFDLLYLDPPYNARQYPGYYHIPELIATGWFGREVATRGKTGLLDDGDKRSDWSRARTCVTAFERLVAAAPWRRLVMSYNGEGIIPEATIERVLRENGRAGTYRRYRSAYRRYRSDADGEGRKYSGDSVYEYLYCVDR